ncbi:MAG: hypothetical protein IKT40_12865 [Bacilli bacterium]|nr:hypothetical protein [Bacilli bacterium]
MRNMRDAAVQNILSGAIPNQKPLRDFSKIRIGTKSIEDGLLDLNALNKQKKSSYDNKSTVLKALTSQNYTELRQISQYYFETSGIYNRLCKYLAYLFKYDYYVIPYIIEDIEDNEKKTEKVLSDFSKVLNYLDDSNLKLQFGNIALSVIKNGCYYGYKIPYPDKIVIQELPVKYCRSRFTQGVVPVVEFNMKFFDDQFKDIEQKMKMLKLFPKEFRKGYVLYKEGKLKAETPGDSEGWFALEPGLALKFNLNNSDYPILAGAIPAIIDLENAQEMDRKKVMQELLKIIIQKLPLDKNNDLVFDMEEARDIHNNTVQMLSKAIGVDVLTTFADVEVADMADKNSSTTTDDLQRVERNLFNQTGISGNLFNTDGNIALEKSVLNDEASIYNLILQFQVFLNEVLDAEFNKNKKKYYFKVQMLNTTIYNYTDLSNKYRELVQIGYSKMLPMIALGHSQSAILATVSFENDVLKLPEKMIPPLMSSTMSSQDVLSKKSDGGRPEKENDEKSEKTIQNRESMGKEGKKE